MNLFDTRSQQIAATPFRQNGFSVVELMVSLTISAFLVIGLVQIFSSVRASYALQENLARVQENSRFVTSFMSRHLREAGRFPLAEHESPNIDIGFTLPNILTGALPDPLDDGTVEGAGLTSDSIEINVFTDLDCFGNVNTVATGTGISAIWLKQISFTLSIFSNELLYTCRYGSPIPIGTEPPIIINSQPLVSNVETLQFLYGEDLDGDASADRYVRAGNWDAPGNVVAIRAGLIITSDDTSSFPPDARDIELMGNTYAATGQRHLRHPVVMNISLRNQTL